MKTMNGIETRRSIERRRQHTVRGGPVIWTAALALLAVALSGTNAAAQAPPTSPIDVAGTVLNKESGQPVADAVVSLTKASTGVLTDDQGRFKLEKVDPGSVSISAEKLGYETLTWEGTVGPNEDQLTLELPPKDSILNGLHTEIARFRHRRRAASVAVQSFDQSELQRTSQPNVMDFVNTHAGVANVDCPGLLGSDQCYEVQGMVVMPIVYVDDVPMAGGEGYLESMSPHDAYLLEVYAQGAEIRVYTPHFMLRAARTDYRPRALGF